MREIKFRVYEKLTGYMSCSGIEYYPTFHLYLRDNNRFIVMQYTGVKDINNKEIYEGDLVMVEDCNNNKGSYIVAWNNEDSMYVLKDKYGYCDRLCDFDKYKIVGNIYQNKNLLEEVI